MGKTLVKRRKILKIYTDGAARGNPSSNRRDSCIYLQYCNLQEIKNKFEESLIQR